MGWETRTESANVYYTRSRWLGGRVIREYVGAAGSPMAQLAVVEDAMHREARERALLDRRTERERLAALDAPLVALGVVGDALLWTTWVSAGYHRHDRGEWRRRRGHQG